MTTNKEKTAIYKRIKTAEGIEILEEMPIKKSKKIPIFKDEIIKNPNDNTLFPINWEERLDEDRYWYEDEAVYDEYGNYTTKKNFYIVLKRLVGCYSPKKPRGSIGKPLFEIGNNFEEEEDELL